MPADTLYTPTRQYLELLRKFDGALAGKWLLEHGRSFGDFSGKLPRGVTRGLPKYCYWNALKLAHRFPKRFVYVEGMATNLIAACHAWCWDCKTGRIVDPTWSEGFDYIGVPFKLAYAKQHMNLDEGDTPLMNMSADFPVITGEHAIEMWMETQGVTK
jgi:hypothetical protein